MRQHYRPLLLVHVMQPLPLVHRPHRLSLRRMPSNATFRSVVDIRRRRRTLNTLLRRIRMPRCRLQSRMGPLFPPGPVQSVQHPTGHPRIAATQTSPSSNQPTRLPQTPHSAPANVPSHASRHALPPLASPHPYAATRTRRIRSKALIQQGQAARRARIHLLITRDRVVPGKFQQCLRL